MPRVLQWVAALGLVSSVRVTTRSTSASEIVRGAPGLGSSARPSSLRSTNRRRQVPTVAVQTRRRAATLLLSRPSAQARTIRARVARRWVLLGREAQVFKVCLSSSLRISSAIGRGMCRSPLRRLYRANGQGARLSNGLPTQDTSKLGLDGVSNVAAGVRRNAARVRDLLVSLRILKH